MSIYHLKKYIKNNFINSDSKLKYGLTDNYFNKNQKHSKFVEDLYNATSFLSNKYTIKDRISFIYNDMEQPYCDICQSPINRKGRSSFFAEYCSNKCAAIATSKKAKKTAKENDSYKKRAEKIKKTMQERYDVDNPSQLPKTIAKIKKTMQERYGVDNPIHLKKTKNSIAKYNNERLTKFAKDILSNKEKLLTIYDKKKTTKNVAEYLGVGESTVIRYVNLHNINDKCFKNKNGFEIDVIKFIKQVSATKIISHDRKILNGQEIDILLPEFNIGIECNGVYWHSENAGKDKNYHLYKTELAEKNNIQLFHIFDSEWYDETKNKIWKSVLLSAMGKQNRIYARKTAIKQISNKLASDFLNCNHMQGKDNSPICYGLFYMNELVSVMTFAKSRFDKKYEYEIVRFANKLNTTVVGGASKLLKHFMHDYNPKSIISYANRRWSNGNLYKKLGFAYCSKTSPNYFYLVNGKLENRTKYMKHKLSKILENFDETKTEYENMTNHGFVRIFDSGNLKYVLNL